MTNPIINDLLPTCNHALNLVRTVYLDAVQTVQAKIVEDGKISAVKLESQQFTVHGLAWLATYVESLQQMLSWAQSLDNNSNFSEIDQLILQISFGEYLNQIAGGIPMSQGEIARLTDIGVSVPDDFLGSELIRNGNTDPARKRLVDLMIEQQGMPVFGSSGLDDEYKMIRDQFRRFVEDKVAPFAHDWHLKDELIPMTVLQEMADLGVFGLTIPEEYGGFGMDKTAMCVVTEELARGYIGVGSLGTRSEIAAELILCGGTEEQKHRWLPDIASAKILPTAVFTEPNTGSDLGSLSTRAVLQGDKFVITGNKTWITHAARADMMIILARTNPETTNYSGLSMLLGEKPRGTDKNPFPADGMSGSEIGVLGYRGMKEYELAFDGFTVDRKNLLGELEGQGFKQLMQTFESARIQTAARAIGVAQSALELGMQYALDRKQFGKSLIHFPRVYGKLAVMAVEIMICRQLTYFAASQKDKGNRCDLEAGMAKLLAARVAWASADNAVQIHGGNGFALEYPVSRVLCDARILNIFEGAAEIQATVIARRILQ
ncbi:MAG: acyl-CoA/acyl-ACP dehydrogenase [Rhodobacteraceae bacterium]|nr:acyl-CoA/acyl-ACP dehydrogenase [Paracoccaceae bacterium]